MKNIDMKNLVFVVVMIVNATAVCQTVNYNTIILPGSAVDISFEEKLVRLAWQNSPDNKILNSQINISEYEIKQSRRNWLNNIRVSGNLNEFNIDKSADIFQRSDFNPRYNIGVSFPLGSLFTDPLETKRRIELQRMAIEAVNLEKLQLRSEILSRYQQYLTSKEILDIRIESLEDSYSNYILIEQSFRSGETNIIQFNLALEKYANQRQLKAEADGIFKITKISLEELIGVPLEDVK